MVPRPRVLVVDDEMWPRESFRLLLQPRYEIEVADSSHTALKAVDTFRPDVVLLDIRMPDVDGLATLGLIKQRDPSIEVVMITGDAEAESLQLALRGGAFTYLIKPFSQHELEMAVDEALGRRVQRRPGFGKDLDAPPARRDVAPLCPMPAAPDDHDRPPRQARRRTPGLSKLWAFIIRGRRCGRIRPPWADDLCL